MTKKAIILNRNVKVGKEILAAGTKIPASHESYDELKAFGGGVENKEVVVKEATVITPGTPAPKAPVTPIDTPDVPVSTNGNEDEDDGNQDPVTVDTFNAKQLKAMLDDQEIEYDKRALKPVLFKLLDENGEFRLPEETE